MVGTKNSLTIKDIIEIKRSKMKLKLEKHGDDKIVNSRVKKILKMWLEHGVYNCEECLKSSKTKFSSIQCSALENHVELNHPEYEPFKCNFCEERFKQHRVRTTHVKRVHYSLILLKLKL